MCVTGAECTGKTTLAERLGAHYGAPVLLEHGRDYFTEKARFGDPRVSTLDILNVVEMQVRLEDSAPRNAPMVVLDTDVFTVGVWHERSLGYRIPELDRLVRARHVGQGHVDLYLLTAPDIPFIYDDVRMSESQRAVMHEVFRATLRDSGRVYTELYGDVDSRLAGAVRAIEELAQLQDRPVVPTGS